jgi:hypothetical protein
VSLGEASFAFPMRPPDSSVVVNLDVDAERSWPIGWTVQADPDPTTGQLVRDDAVLFFVMQEQNEIANQDVLFHTQGDEHRPNAIRAVIPYFLVRQPPMAS